MDFSWHVISREGIGADSRKTEAIQELPEPKDVTELQRFNGMVNQLAKFLSDLAKLDEPLRQLLRKDQEWLWDEPQRQAFKEIKSKLSSTKVLAHYNPKVSSIIAAHGCQNGLGAVLLQRAKDGDRCPIAYASISLTDTEKN